MVREARLRRRGRFRWGGLALAAVLISLWATDATAQGAEEQLQNEPAPESVEDLKLSGDDQFEEEKRRRPVLGLIGRPLERWLLEIPGIEDPTFSVQFRSYYLRRKRMDNGRTEAWTYGGSAFQDTGWIRDRVALGTESTSPSAFTPRATAGARCCCARCSAPTTSSGRHT